MRFVYLLIPAQLFTTQEQKEWRSQVPRKVWEAATEGSRHTMIHVSADAMGIVDQRRTGSGKDPAFCRKIGEILLKILRQQRRLIRLL